MKCLVELPGEQELSANEERITDRKAAAASWLRICCGFVVAVTTGLGEGVTVGLGSDVAVDVGECATFGPVLWAPDPRREAVAIAPPTRRRQSTAAMTAARSTGRRRGDDDSLRA